MSGTLGEVSKVLHVSGDYPDSIDSFKTPVIKTLIALTRTQFHHDVLSLNRRNPAMGSFAADVLLRLGRPRLHTASEPFEDGTAMRYDAPPKGLYHAAMLRQLGDEIARQIERSQRKPDLIVGHKLAIEGIAVRRAANVTGIPYAISIQGDTDTKIIDARPDLRGELARVFHGAAMVFPFAPWALKRVEGKLGLRKGPVCMLPCPTDLDTPNPPATGGDGFVSVFHLKNHSRKNLQGMAAAMRLAAEQGTPLTLTVIGGGSPTEVAQCEALAKGAERLTFAGPMGRDELRARMKTATAFVMPSLRESFGLVFIEALFAGLPIIYPAGTAVDGFFDGAPFAIGVDARDPSAIAKAMQFAVSEEGRIKAALAAWQESPDARRFTREAIGEAFAEGLTTAVTAER
ncbi:MAG: glycosyltransferase family 4 protein [Pseudomonadota bacterium]